MDNSRNKSKKNKILLKPKSKSSVDEMDDAETQLLSPVERVKVNHLATTPITAAGNIVDMQGSLNQATPDKMDDDKTNASKNDINKEEVHKDSPPTEASQKELAKESNLPEENEALKSENEDKLVSENDAESQVSNTETKQSEDSLQNKDSAPVTDSTIKQNVQESQGKYIKYLNIL